MKLHSVKIRNVVHNNTKEEEEEEEEDRERCNNIMNQ